MAKTVDAYLFKTKRIAASLLGIVVLVGASLGLGAITPSVAAASCNDNYVIRCGTTSAAALKQAYDSDSFVQHVYTYFDISSTDINNLGTTMVQGSVTKSGSVIVNGATVATGALTAGRDNLAGSTKVTFQGSTFYQRPPSASFLQPSLAAWIVMQNGQFKFAVLPSCGNPVKATPVKPPTPKPTPFAVCKDLDVNKHGNTITATVTSTLKNGATYKTTLYTFGDGISIPTAQTTVIHTYRSPGTYRITARQTFSTGTEQTVQPACAKTITIPPALTTATPKPPAQLLNTGAGSITALAGIFAGTVVFGALSYRLRLLHKLHH